MKEALLKGDFDALVSSMEAGWHAKKHLAKSISNPDIDAATSWRSRPACAPARSPAPAAAAS